MLPPLDAELMKQLRAAWNAAPLATPSPPPIQPARGCTSHGDPTLWLDAPAPKPAGLDSDHLPPL